MTYPAAAIRTAVAELLEGTIGSIRTCPPGTFLRGVFPGQPAQTQRAKAIQTSTARHYFDVKLGQLRNNPSTPIGRLGDYELNDLDITVTVTSKIATVAQADQRDTDLALIASDCKLAAKALAFPHNLDETSAAVATDIVGGCLLGPDATSPIIEATDENWGEQLARTVIRCRAILRIDQDIEAPLTHETFSTAMIAAGGAELQEFWLAYDDDAFRTIGSAANLVEAWIGQVSGVEAIQGTDARQPEIQAREASNQRDQLSFTRTLFQNLATTASFTAAEGERWCVWTVGKLPAAPSVSGRINEFGRAATGDTLRMFHINTPTLEFGVNYDDGATGADDVANIAYASAEPVSIAIAAANPHQAYLNGVWNNLSQTPGISERATGGNSLLTWARACDNSLLGFVEMDVWFTALFKMSTAGLPSGFTAMSALAREFYDVDTL